MGAKLSCPQGFEQGLFFTCHAKCPSEFKYVQESGSTVGPAVEKCVHIRRNNRFFTLTPLPQIEPENQIPSSYGDELRRVKDEGARVQKQVDSESKLAAELENNYAKEYSRIDSEYASYKETTSALREIEQVKNSLKPFRPPTAPASDLEEERKAITDIASRNLYYIQLALFLVVLVMLSYIVLPLESANLIAFSLLCIGIASGFFLRR